MTLLSRLFPATTPDLLDHPDLKRMTPLQLADLPLPRLAADELAAESRPEPAGPRGTERG